jgi:hypothetical protein
LPEIGNDDNGGESDVESPERHYRITLDFRLLLRPITPELFRESVFFRDGSASAGGPHSSEKVERQRRLYGLLRGDPEALERYLLTVLTREAGVLAFEGLPAAFDAADEEEVLAPLCRAMGEEDAGFFEECRQRGVLAENTELIWTAFKVELVGAELAEVSRRAEGDVKRIEAARRGVR